MAEKPLVGKKTIGQNILTALQKKTLTRKQLLRACGNARLDSLILSIEDLLNDEFIVKRPKYKITNAGVLRLGQFLRPRYTKKRYKPKKYIVDQHSRKPYHKNVDFRRIIMTLIREKGHVFFLNATCFNVWQAANYKINNLIYNCKDSDMLIQLFNAHTDYYLPYKGEKSLTSMTDQVHVGKSNAGINLLINRLKLVEDVRSSDEHHFVKERFQGFTEGL